MNNKRKPEPGDTAWRFIFAMLVLIILALWIAGCAQDPLIATRPSDTQPKAVKEWCSTHPEDRNCEWLNAACAEDAKVDAWLSRAAPWIAGIFLGSMAIIWVWALMFFRRAAIIGDRLITAAGSEEGANRILDQFDADNAARLAGGFSAYAFGQNKRMDER